MMEENYEIITLDGTLPEMYLGKEQGHYVSFFINIKNIIVEDLTRGASLEILLPNKWECERLKTLITNDEISTRISLIIRIEEDKLIVKRLFIR